MDRSEIIDPDLSGKHPNKKETWSDKLTIFHGHKLTACSFLGF
jgi:hypothetical protein